MEALQTSLRQASDDASSYVELDRVIHMDSDSLNTITENMANLDIEFPFDESIVNSKVYRKAFRAYLSIPAEQNQTDGPSYEVNFLGDDTSKYILPGLR
jgi:hypothetical protein